MIDNSKQWALHQGDALTVLRTLPAESVQCAITSPPYFGLRDYGTGKWEGGDPACEHKNTNGQRIADSEASVRGGGHKAAKSGPTPMKATCSRCGAIRVDQQIGLEQTPAEFVGKLVAVFAEVRRVLRKDGVCFVNIGDSYASAWACSRRSKIGNGSPDMSTMRPDRLTGGLKEKDLIGIPWMLAFALRDDGWYLRSDIIWSKPNPMPESVRDRPTKAHEYLFLLTKSQRYFWDAEAIAEKGSGLSGGACFGKVNKDGPGSRRLSAEDNDAIRDGTRNARSVWTIPTQPFPEAHFATFPEELVRRCVLAGTSAEGCCPDCGKPWVRVVERKRTFESGSGRSGNPINGKQAPVQGAGYGDIRMGPVVSTHTTGWQPACKCGKSPVPCRVLDPFTGSGTVGAVCVQTGRQFVGIELNPEYVAMARKRIAEAQEEVACPLFEPPVEEEGGLF